MGCDIHPYLEVRTLEGYSRTDEVVRKLQREASAGDPDAAAKLVEYELRSPWVFGAGFKYDQSEEELIEEMEGSSYLEPALKAHRLWYALPEEQRTKVDWRQRYSIQDELSPVPRNRDYYLFAWLTGTVRNWGETNKVRGITEEPKGFPEDASKYVRAEYDYEGPDAHSASWLTAREVVEAPPFMVENETDSHHRDSESADQLKTLLAQWGRVYGLDNVRFVFWFDN